jgi:hypothetical protein
VCVCARVYVAASHSMVCCRSSGLIWLALKTAFGRMTTHRSQSSSHQIISPCAAASQSFLRCSPEGKKPPRLHCAHPTRMR